MKLAKPPRNRIVILILIAAIFIIAAFFMTNRKNSINYAQEVAAPIEALLVNGGATRVCTNGDAGRGIGNTEPWYIAYFQTSLNLEQAEALGLKAANEAGFVLSKQEQGVKGYLGDLVYLDAQSKKSSHSDLKEGNTTVAIAFTNETTLHACTPNDIKTDANHTAITLEVRLPRFK